jgi:hypothetical protein
MTLTPEPTTLRKEHQTTKMGVSKVLTPIEETTPTVLS